MDRDLILQMGKTLHLDTNLRTDCFAPIRPHHILSAILDQFLLRRSNRDQDVVASIDHIGHIVAEQDVTVVTFLGNAS
jgi:hypothetical protein